MIHEVMLMAYEQGFEEGRKQAYGAEELKHKERIAYEEGYNQGVEEGKGQALEEIKALKASNHKLRMDRDFSHNPHDNIYATLKNYDAEKEYDK